MPSNNKNIIGDLRGKFDPHYKLASNVEGIEKGLGIEVAKLHKTLSKSFAMQRKTLARVLGLEGRVGVLESQQAAEEQAQEGIDEILDEILGEDSQEESEIGGTKTKTKPKVKKRPATPVGKKIPTGKKKPKIKAKKKKIKAKDIGYSSRVFGKDKSGEYVSPEERKKRFKLGDKQPAGEPSKDVVEPPASAAQASPVSDGLLNAVKGIAASVDRIKESLLNQGKVQKSASEKSRRAGEEKEAKKREGGLEKFLGPVKAAGAKVLAPFKSMMESVFEFLTKILFGRVVFKLFEWFANPANADKVQSIFKFIADWWPVIVAGLMAIIGPGVAFTVGLVALLAWGIPKVIDAVKSVFGFGKDVDKELKQGGDKLDKAITDSGKEAEKKLEPGKEEVDAPEGDTPAELSEVQNSAQEVQQQDTQGLAEGGPVEKKGEEEVGQVTGKKGKDKVPAMLTDGEFVMSKGAVQQYGADTLAGMNAAAGGTNKPEVVKGVPRFSGGGPVGQMPSETTVSDGAPGATGSTGSSGSDGASGSDGSSGKKGGGIFGAIGGAFGKATQLFNPQIMIVKNLIGGIRDMVTKGHETMHKAMGAGKIEKHLKGHSKEEKKHKLIHKRIMNTAGSTPGTGGFKPIGLGRLIAGGMDKLTGDKFDFDKRGGPVISKDQKGRGDNITPPNKSAANQSLTASSIDASADADVPMEPAPGIPSIDAAVMRSQSKIRTLGVSL